jgi:hypothetical protein
MVNKQGENNMQAQDLSNIRTVYSGKIGCMCGCKGKYSRIAESPRSVKIIANKLIKNPNTQYDALAKCFYLQTDTRMLAAYTEDV